MAASNRSSSGHRSRAGALPSPEVLFRARSSHEIQRPASDAVIAWSEKQLGVRLPRSYIDLVKVRNGGTLRLSGMLAIESPDHGRAIYNISRISGLHRRHFEAITQKTETLRRWGVSDGLVAFGGDDQRDLCFDYRERKASREPAITLVDPEMEKEYRISRSFDDLLRGLHFDASGDLVLAIDDPELTGESLHDRLQPLNRRRVPIPDEKNAPPRRWKIRRFRGDYDKEASILVVENGSVDPWHLARPPKHPLMLLSVAEADQAACVKALFEAIPEGLALLHVPADRKQVPGIPVEPWPDEPVKATRARPSKPKELDPTDLNAAVIKVDRRRVKELLEAGAAPDKRYGAGYSTALEVAAFHGLDQIFDLLYGHATKAPTAKLFEQAVHGGSVRIVSRLLGAGVKPSPRDLTRAVTSRHEKVVRLLLDAGVRPTEEALQRAAGVTTANERGFPDKAAPRIMRMMKDEGLRARRVEVRRRFEQFEQ